MGGSLIFIRHGETLDNARGVAQGWSDSLLSETGRGQVEKLARRAASLGATRLVCSPLPRALSTAEGIAKETGLEITQIEDLREMNYGEWEGASFDQVRRDSPELFGKWSTDPTTACPGGGESFADVAERMRRAVARIEQEQNGPNSRVLIVSHGTAIRIVATALLGLDIAAARRLAQDNAAINIFEWRSSRYLLKLWNDTAHYQVV